MPQIFVDTDHGAMNKLYVADKASSNAADAVKAMRAAVKAVVDGNSVFTSIKVDELSGYRIRLKLTKVDASAGKTNCEVSGEIVRISATKDGEPAEELLSLGAKSSGTVDGIKKDDMLACVDAIAADFATKSLKIIKEDTRKRSGGK